MNQENTGAFIREIRKEKGLTQEQFAEKLGVSQRSVSRWETGKTMPDYSLLPDICEVLGINVAELLEAERIEGDSVPKGRVNAMAQNMIAHMSDKKRIRRMIGAVVSAVVMLACMIGLYCLEYNVFAESTVELEQAIDKYSFHDDASADILESCTLGNHLYVLYGEKEYPGACGLACLERGIFGNYRIISSDKRDSRWINRKVITEGKKKYCVTYCANTLPGIDSYGICGINENIGTDMPVDESQVLYKAEYRGLPFMTFTELADGDVITPYPVKYYKDGEEIPEEQLTSLFGEHSVDGAPTGGTFTAELGMFYVFEGIVLLLGIAFIRFFMADKPSGKNKK